MVYFDPFLLQDNVRNTLEVVRIDQSRLHRTLLTGLNKPMAIAVHPLKGFVIFYI